MVPFEGVAQDLFSVYVPERWSSNVHNLQRMRNKDVVQQLCTAAVAAIPELQSGPGAQGGAGGLDRQASDEFPNIVNHKRVEAQWVFWYRDAAARQALAAFLERTPLHERTIFNIAPQDKHVVLAVTVRHDGIWCGLRMAPGAHIDRRNLMAKLSQTWEHERALTLVRGLPAGAQVRMGELALPSDAVDAQALSGLSEQLTPEGEALAIGVAWSPEQAVAMQAGLPAAIEATLRALLPLYRFIAWTRDNDLIELSKQLQTRRVQVRQAAASFATGERVRFVSGLFTGKVGVVQAVDARAQVRVQVGKMSITVAGADLAAAS